MSTSTAVKKIGSVERKELTINASQVSVDQIVMVYHFAKVKQIYNHGRDNMKVLLEDLDFKTDLGEPFQFQVDGKNLVEKCLSAEIYLEEISLPRTKIVDILTTLYNSPAKAEWVKKDGSTRVARFRYLGPIPQDGRSLVEDLDKTENRNIEIDHRTLKWLITRGVKYTSNSKS